MGKINLKLVVIVCLGLISLLAAACGGGEEPILLTATPSPTQSPPTPTPTAIPLSYTIAGNVLDSSTSLLMGGQVTLEPSGKSATTDVSDGTYVITDVPDGEYLVSVAPQCVAYGCYPPKLLIVSGGDILDFHLAPLPASLLLGGPPAVRNLSRTSSDSLQLDEIELAGDSLLLISPNDMQAGESAQIVLAAPECLRCAVLLAVDTPVAWSVEPRGSAVIEAETGLLSIDPATPTGITFTVTAEVGDGRYLVSAEVDIYSAEENPLAGVWSETETGNINQLLLTSGGEFAVTINPFGSYQDYWGTYTFDLSTGFIELTATGANQVAPDGQGTGTFAIDASGKLFLEGICLGGWDSNTQSLAMNCGHEFVK